MLDICVAVIITIGLQGPYDALELFAGEKAVTRACARHGYTAVPYEKKDTPAFDILSIGGFILALTLVLSLKFGGFLLAAPVCSTWVWMSRASTGRKLANPGGSTASCAMANIMVSRVCFLIRVASALGVLWVFEQPANSLLAEYHRVQELFRAMMVFRSTFRMDMFGGKTAKPTWLYSNTSLAQLKWWKSFVSTAGNHKLVTTGYSSTGKNK